MVASAGAGLGNTIDLTDRPMHSAAVTAELRIIPTAVFD
jgi:hypothetical protein